MSKPTKEISLGLLFCVLSLQIVCGQTQKKQSEEALQLNETRAIPKGGMGRFYRHINKHLKYPKAAKNKKVEGRVILDCIIEKDGTLTVSKVKQKLGFGCDEEAIKVVNKSPKWIPATKRGVKVKYRIFIPVEFKLKK